MRGKEELRRKAKTREDNVVYKEKTEEGSAWENRESQKWEESGGG